MTAHRRVALAAIAMAAAATLAACSSPASTTPAADTTEVSTWPESGTNIEWIVPSAAGAGNDILARIVAPVLQEELDANVKVVNIEGGSQVIGLSQLAAANPDGTSIGYTNIPSILGRYLDPSKNAPFDRESFTPIGSFATNSVVIGVGKDSPYDTVEDLFEAAEDAPEPSPPPPTPAPVMITSTCASSRTNSAST